MLKYNQRQFERGYQSRDSVDDQRRQVEFSQLTIDVLKSDIKIAKPLKDYQLAELEGELRLLKLSLKRMMSEQWPTPHDETVRSKRILHDHCAKSGLVIHPERRHGKMRQTLQRVAPCTKSKWYCSCPTSIRCRLKLACMKPSEVHSARNASVRETPGSRAI